QDDGAAHALEVPLDRRKHHVLAGELDQRMRGVELPGTTGWNSRFTLRCHVIPSLTKYSFRCCGLRERLTFSFPLPSYFLSGCAGCSAALTHTHGVAISNFQTVLTSIGARRDLTYLVEVATLLCHMFLFSLFLICML